MEKKNFIPVALLIVVMTGCSLFGDLESEHPFSPPADPCVECPEFCIEGECVELDPCDACAADEICVEGRCEPDERCEPGTDPDCEPTHDQNSCLDDSADCARFKQCPNGEEISADEVCPCEEEGTCRCNRETGECAECGTADGERCECNDVLRCRDGAECVDGQCIETEPPPTVCLADEPSQDCERCEPGACPDGYDCVDADGVCFPTLCEPDMMICVHVCLDGECPGTHRCNADGFCVPDQCLCPSEMMCTASDPRCRTAGGELLQCDADETCEPGMCIEGYCIGG